MKALFKKAETTSMKLLGKNHKFNDLENVLRSFKMRIMYILISIFIKTML